MPNSSSENRVLHWGNQLFNKISSTTTSFTLYTGCVSESSNFKKSRTVNAFIYLVSMHVKQVYIKEFRFNLTHWKQKSYFPKIASFRWPPFRSRYAVSLLRTSPIILDFLLNSMFQLLNYVWCWSFERLEISDTPRERNHMLKDRVTWPAKWCPNIWR